MWRGIMLVAALLASLPALSAPPQPPPGWWEPKTPPPPAAAPLRPVIVKRIIVKHPIIRPKVIVRRIVVRPKPHRHRARRAHRCAFLFFGCR
jgi:hypothetical protein